MHRISSIFFGLAVGLAVLASGCGPSMGQQTTYRVSFHAGNGKLIQTWENAQHADAQWHNDRCEIRDADGKGHVVFGVIIVEENYKQPGENPGTHTVTLYNNDGGVIRTWRASQVDPVWDSNLVRFVDQETGHRFDVIGHVQITPL